MILNNGKSSHLLNWDIRHLRPSRLDSSDGPLMVVDMNYPEYRNSSILNRGPLRDSHAGNAAGSQIVNGTYYPNDVVEYGSNTSRETGSITKSPDPVFNGGILNLKMLPVPFLQDGNRGKPAASFYTVHFGMPIRTRRTYIGAGIYQLRGNGTQISHWQVNNNKGDLSEFHKYYTDPNGNNDSDQKIFVEQNLHKNYIPIGASYISYPNVINSSVRDIELTNSAFTYLLSDNDPIADTTAKCGTIRRYPTDYGTAQNFGSWRPGSGVPFRVPTTIATLDSDFFNANGEDWWISRVSGNYNFDAHAYKMRMQLGPTPNGNPTYGDDNLKVLIHCTGLKKQSEGWDGYNTFVDDSWIISATMSNYQGSSFTIDSDQYHFNLKRHSSNPNSGINTYWANRGFDAFDISQDGKIMTLVANNFAGGQELVNFVLDTPWDLSTVQPFDYFDSATTGNGSFTRNGDALVASSGQSLNNPKYDIYSDADSAATYRLENVADWKGMTLGYAGIDWDDLADHVSAWSTIGPPALFPLNRFDSAFNQINAFGDPLGDMDSGGYGGPGDKDADIVRRFGSNAKHLRDSESFALFGDSSRLQAKIDELIHAPINHADSGYTSIADFYDYYVGDLNPHVVYTKASSYRRGWANGINSICWNHTGEYLYVVNNYGGVVQYECTALRDSNSQANRYSFADSGSDGDIINGRPVGGGDMVFYGRPGL